MPLARAAPAEAAAFLAAHPAVDAVDLVFTNLAGVARGKRLRRGELLPFFESGRFLPGSLLVNDIRGDDVPETGLVWADGDADRLAWPAPATLSAMPWAGPGAAQVVASLHELDGTPCALDPRAILARVVDAFASDKLTPVVACELEFYLLAPDAVRPAGDGAPQVYGLHELDALRGFLDAVNAAGDAAGLAVEAAISENAPGQYEIGLRHHADALRAADEAVLFKRIVRGVAAAHGTRATFMAKPFAATAGSGLHVHLSVDDADGRNVFAAAAPEGSPALGHAVAGLVAFLPDSLGLLAPNANSYRRFRSGSYAPTGAGWGVNNRTVAFRVPAGPPASRHIEHRIAGADANPYLAVAAVLAAALLGLRRQMSPPAITVGNAYAGGGGHRPPTWDGALDRLDEPSPLDDLLGADVRRIFAVVKRHERDAFDAPVPPAEHDWYLHTA